MPYIEEIELAWILQFDYIIVNSLQNMICANRISERRPVLWWLHEHSGQYEGIIEQYGIRSFAAKTISICAVSDLAKNYFLEYYPMERAKIMPFGLPDFYRKSLMRHDRIIIAVIGTIISHKNQIGLINAMKRLADYEREQIECWIIGRDGSKQYRKELDGLIKDCPQIKICGEMSREEIEEVFCMIDVVVCSSFVETMSIAIVEGMMNEKICIASSSAGIARYIRNEENGFVYNVENVDELTDRLKYIIHNFEALDSMKKRARETYERYFTIEKISDNLQKIMTELSVT